MAARARAARPPLTWLRRLRIAAALVAVVTTAMLAVSSRWAAAGVLWVTGSGEAYSLWIGLGLLGAEWTGNDDNEVAPTQWAVRWQSTNSVYPGPGGSPGIALTGVRSADGDHISLAWRPYHVASKSGARPNHHGIMVPLWLVALPALLAGAYTHGRIVGAQRVDNTRCAGCSYARTGLTKDAPCPECGQPAPHR